MRKTHRAECLAGEDAGTGEPASKPASLRSNRGGSEGETEMTGEDALAEAVVRALFIIRALIWFLCLFICVCLAFHYVHGRGKKDQALEECRGLRCPTILSGTPRFVDGACQCTETAK
jgi:preprotein translocase subunit SecG